MSRAKARKGAHSHPGVRSLLQVANDGVTYVLMRPLYAAQ
jgi:hypothetical protein